MFLIYVQKVLNKDPIKRPSLAEIKKDPFFNEIDWVKLYLKELKPPIILEKKDDKNPKVNSRRNSINKSKV